MKRYTANAAGMQIETGSLMQAAKWCWDNRQLHGAHVWDNLDDRTIYGPTGKRPRTTEDVLWRPAIYNV